MVLSMIFTVTKPIFQHHDIELG